MKMVVAVNGEPHEFDEGSSLADVLERLGIPMQTGIAVAVNDAVVPRGRLKEYRVREGDALEIIGAVAGG